MTYEEALEKALELRNDPQALDSFMHCVTEMRPRLESDLTLIRSARAEIAALSPSRASTERAERQLMRVVAGQESIESSRQSRLSRFATWRIAVVGATAAAAVVAALFVASPDAPTLSPSNAEAVVVEGSVADVSPEGVTINTASGPRTFSLADDTALQDGFGNRVSIASLRPGQIVILTARSSDGMLVPQTLEIRDRLFGSLTAMTSESITLRSGDSWYLIRLSPKTEVEGNLAVGVQIEVEVEQLKDGSFWAEEIEVEDQDSDGHHYRDDDHGKDDRDEDD